jgi:hypothetical protein
MIQTNKWTDELNRHFSKEVEMTNKYTKKCSTPLAIRKTQVKTTMRFHFTPVRMAIIRKKRTTNAGEDVEEKETLSLGWGVAQVVEHLLSNCEAQRWKPSTSNKTKQNPPIHCRWECKLGNVN